MFRLKCICSSYRNVLKRTWKIVKSEFQPQLKGQESSYLLRQILAFFCNFIARTIGQNCKKCLQVTKIVKKIKFEEVCYELESKFSLQRHSFTKYLRLTLVLTGI